MSWFNELERSHLTNKAHFIYNKCLRAGKIELAKKIEQKYRLVYKSENWLNLESYPMPISKNV